MKDKYKNITFTEFVDLFTRFLIKKTDKMKKQLKTEKKVDTPLVVKPNEKIIFNKAEKVDLTDTFVYNGLHIISLKSMEGHKIAKRCGNKLFVSPAMFVLVKEAATNEERIFILKHIKYHNYTLENVQNDPLLAGIRHRVYKEDFEDHTVE